MFGVRGVTTEEQIESIVRVEFRRLQEQDLIRRLENLLGEYDPKYKTGWVLLEAAVDAIATAIRVKNAKK